LEYHIRLLGPADAALLNQVAEGVFDPDQPHELYLDKMDVTPTSWGQGIGGRLLDTLLDWARERDCHYALAGYRGR
jgi:GNAT superfamily N-acetyltransferase